VADEDNGAADSADRCFHQGDVLYRCVEAVLRSDTLIALRLKGNDQLAEARAIGPESVAEHDAWFSFGHFPLLGYISHILASTEAELKTSPTPSINFAKNIA
jgi:hypothetical protein